MSASISETRSGDQQREMRECPYCHILFTPKREAQQFCKTPCRVAYHNDFGAQGVVAGVTRLKRGVSVVLHFPDGPAAESAINFRKGDVLSAVRKP